jgi:hypothetical protein
MKTVHKYAALGFALWSLAAFAQMPDKPATAEQRQARHAEMKAKCEADPVACEARRVEMKQRMTERHAAMKAKCAEDPKACEAKRKERHAKMQAKHAEMKAQCEADPQACADKKAAMREKMKSHREAMPPKALNSGPEAKPAQQPEMTKTSL